MQIHGETSIACNRKDLTWANTFNNSPVGRTNLDTQKFLSTKNTRDRLADKTLHLIDGFKNSNAESLSNQCEKGTIEKISRLAAVKSSPRKNNVTSPKTRTLNSKPKNIEKPAHITIKPCELSFEDVYKYTNIESCIKNDILRKFPTKSEVYLLSIERYIKKYYYAGFIHKKTWPRNLKFKDTSIHTMEDLKSFKEKEKVDAHSKSQICQPIGSTEIHKTNTKENNIKLSSGSFVTSDENNDNVNKSFGEKCLSIKKASEMCSASRTSYKVLDQLAVNSKNDRSSMNVNEDTIHEKTLHCNGASSKTIVNSPRSKKILEIIDFENDFDSESSSKPSILPCQISYDDFRNFTNIESCVHDDILRKDPANSQLHFTRVKTYIKKYYEHYFSKRKKWPSRIKFLDKTIKTMDDLNRKKGRMRNESAVRETVLETPGNDTKNESVIKTPHSTCKEEKISNVNPPITFLPSRSENNKGKTVFETEDTAYQSSDLQKIAFKPRCKKAKLLQMKENVISPTRKYLKNRRHIACPNSPFNVKTTFADMSSNLNASLSKSNSSNDVESLSNYTESSSMLYVSSLESLQTDIISPSNRFRRKRNRKSKDVDDKFTKMLRLKNDDETNEDTMLDSDGESSHTSEDSIETTLFPFSHNIFCNRQILDGNATVIHDRGDVKVQQIKEEANNNVTNEELDVLRNLCKSLELELSNDADSPEVVIKSEWQEENTVQMKLINSYLKRLSKLVSNSKQNLMANQWNQSPDPIIPETKQEIVDNCSERTDNNFSTNSSDVIVIENNVSEGITIRDSGDTVEDLLEQMMNILDEVGVLQNDVRNKRVNESDSTETRNLEQSPSISEKQQTDCSDDLEIEQFFEELTKVMESPEDNHKDIPPNNGLCARFLPFKHIKSLKSAQHKSDNEDNIKTKCLQDRQAKGSNEIKSISEVSSALEQNLLGQSVEQSISDSKYEVTDYVSDTTITSETSIIIPYQSEKLSHFSNKSRKRKNKNHDQPHRTKRKKLTPSDTENQIGLSKKLVEVREKSIKSKLINKMVRALPRKFVRSNRLAKRIAKSLKFKKHIFRSNSLKSKQVKDSSKQESFDQTRNVLQVVNFETLLQLSAINNDSSSDDETDTSAISQINQPPTCNSFQWITTLHMQHIPRTAMLATSYISSVPLMNAVSNVPLKPKIILWRHKLLIVKIFGDKVHFHMKVDATDEDRMYHFLEISLNRSNACSSNDRVTLRFLQTVFDYLAPIQIEKQNIIIHGAAS